MRKYKGYDRIWGVNEKEGGFFTMRKALSILLAALMLLALAGCRGEVEPEAGDTPAPTGNTVSDDKEDDMENVKITARIEVENYGVIELELYYDIAPQTVANFCYLARKGLYDGVIFHRIIEGFMIQGGDPTGTGSGGPGYCIKGEFALNGFENDLKHERGVISMARLAKPYDSAGSQFFIVQQDSPHLDGGYAAFGRVTSGMDVVDAIAAVATDAYNRPLTPVVIKTVTIEGPELPKPDMLQTIR